MVSLINFKIVNEELQQHQNQQNQLDSEGPQMVENEDAMKRGAGVENDTMSVNNHNNSNRMFIKVMQHEQKNPVYFPQLEQEETSNTTTSNFQLVSVNYNNNKSSIQVPYQQVSAPDNNNSATKHIQVNSNTTYTSNHLNPAVYNSPLSQATQVCIAQHQPNMKQNIPSVLCQETRASFVVTWRNLKFSIEPKWHQKVVNGVAPAFKRKESSISQATGLHRTNSSRNQDENNQQQAHNQICNNSQSAQTDISKIVLDKLDGSFRSGELTAILGPSGAGKTTLLDCLTGHRKHGLSGSIRISSSTLSTSQSTANLTTTTSPSTPCSSPKCHTHRPITHHHRYPSSNSLKSSFTKSHETPGCQKNLGLVCNGQHYTVDTEGGGSGTSNGDNLKVSIIPQNDHLMGHLTVYETLNYASKMKNCFEKQFDHKLNIKRVAQQLSLMSCLGTRINKLSGGQYKRVSIAQELLSSPDILILDEPTSGLDAMTCYQTVQVLRKLTDDRQASGQNQIAVILTIHQPNSDVFQQFNHVYVVAQGGKCIYEGPPSNIESVINRVGIRLPNSYYNPATMIVEIAAAKFGYQAIHKLNSIQKKQYDFIVPDEQTSTGDSAVDCPSSSSNDDDGNDDDDDDMDAGRDTPTKSRINLQNDTANNENFRSFQTVKEMNNNHMHNNNNNSLSGLVNKGFIMEGDEEILPGDTKGTKDNNYKDVVVNLAKAEDNNNNNNHISEDRDSVNKIKMMNSNEQASDIEGRRKKRRRTRKRSGDQNQNNNNTNLNSLSTVLSNRADSSSIGCDKLSSSYGCGAASEGGGSGGGGGGGGGSSREKRLKLNSLKADQKFPFWRHTYLHFHRSWLSIVRDPMLCSMQLALHIIVPVMVSLVYGTNVGKPNACPRAGPMDIMAYALEPTDTALQLQEDLRTTLENIGYIFFKLYGIIFAAMTVTVLTFPLDMHVLVKEFRNGWYGLSSYFLGRTLADIPFQLTLPLLAMSLSYYATGQPYSYMQWRFLSITAILILSSLIAQSQGLLFGAILMDKMKAAVFVAPAATTPIILFAGFLVRTQSIPSYLRPLSNLSYLRYAIEACLISRYGFNQCECDPSLFNQTVPELPPIARSMLDYWLSSFKASTTSEAPELSSNSTSLVETTTLASDIEKPDLFTKLIDSLAKANSFGRNITSCDQVVPYPMIDYDLKDSQLFNCFAILLFMLVFTRLLTFFIVCFKVKRKV